MDDLLDGVLVGIPESTANLQLPDPILRDHYRDEQDRIYWVDTQIDDSTLDLVKYIFRCNKEDEGKSIEERKRILIMIDSPGGSVEVLASILGAMKISKTPCWTCCYCTAYSAAGILLAAGTRRYSLPGTSVMLHSGSCMYSGTVEQAENMKKYFDKLDKKIVENFLTHTTINPKVYKKKAPTDWFMDENEALENGIIDEVIEDLNKLF